MYAPYNELNAFGPSHRTSTLPMASKQSTHLETFVHAHTIFDSLFRPILVEPITFLHLSSSSDTIIVATLALGL